jgi:hypothetical protein
VADRRCDYSPTGELSDDDGVYQHGDIALTVVGATRG